MLRNARSVGVAVATLTPLTALAIGETAQHYDNNNKVVYAKQQLLKWSHSCASEQNIEGSKATASIWLGTAPPKFPYLLSISAGDSPAVVSKTLLTGVKVLGSYDEPTRDTLERLTAPTSTLELAVHKIATRYSALKTALHGNIPEDFDPRVGMKTSAEDTMMDALLDALRDLQYSDTCSDAKSDPDALTNSTAGEVPAPPVFLLRDFNTLSDQEAERWLRWTHQVSSEGLAYVVLLTTSTVTPSKAEWIQARHQSGLSGAGSEGVQDFVGILLRPANNLVDSTSAEEKLHHLAELHDLNLFSDSEQVDEEDGDATEDQNNRATELEFILKTTGNWWSDIDEICRRLKDSNLNSVTLHEERLAIIQEVCSAFNQDTEVKLLELLHLDGSLQFPQGNPASHNSESSVSSDITDTSKAFSALETWKCLETLANVTPVTGGSSLIASPQQLLDQKDKTPLNCVNPVEALLPFNYREEGEQKFLDLIDQQVLFLRPKDAVEIGVIPCKKAALVSPCWIQTRPAVKKAFEKIHRSDTYFRVILELDRFAANVEMRKEVEQYEQEIAERRKSLFDMKRDFTILQFSMTPAEKAQRKAELALIDVELQAKDVYLEKLRSLLTP
ncbi:hypothetical protein F442_08301 [Phytophthora nicotianae P10297]|uniref:Uncharacterized protein n=1 Tax=Phytophthora nicotianae P10297 TaxID=1317064 RepID=W2ZD59_PHYNI|nr:hypothetical protein F442_08301 [Phytophthora nicotianae P10297]